MTHADRTIWKKKWKLIVLTVLIFLVIFFGTFIFLGVGYFLLLQAAWMIGIRLLMFSPRFRIGLFRLLGFEISPGLEVPIPMTTARWWNLLWSSLFILVALYFGFRLIANGYCEQNIFLC